MDTDPTTYCVLTTMYMFAPSTKLSSIITLEINHRHGRAHGLWMRPTAFSLTLVFLFVSFFNGDNKNNVLGVTCLYFVAIDEPPVHIYVGLEVLRLTWHSFFDLGTSSVKMHLYIARLMFE